MIKLDEHTKKQLIKEYDDNKVCLEGNIIKVIVDDGDDKFSKYLQTCLENDKSNRRKRLDITKQIQSQNRELIEWKDENETLTTELKFALDDVSRAKDVVQHDLDVLQKKTQFELIGTIIRVALWIIIGVGLSTTILYSVVLFTGKENKIVESTWSNLFSILLTNCFSIIGTIMGIKYASDNKQKDC